MASRVASVARTLMFECGTPKSSQVRWKRFMALRTSAMTSSGMGAFVPLLQCNQGKIYGIEDVDYTYIEHHKVIFPLDPAGE